MKKRVFHCQNAKGFSLIELLVAMVILCLIVALSAQTVSFVQQTASMAIRSSDCDIEARQIFRRLQTDIDNLVCRKDVFFTLPAGSSLFLSSPASPQTGANDSFLNFYAVVPGYEGDRGIAQVAWRMNETPKQKMQLERGVAGIYYSGDAKRLELLPQSATPELTPVDAADYQVIGTGVFRFEVGYVYEVTSESGAKQWRVSGNLPAGMSLQDAKALFIRMALLDSKALQLLTQTQTVAIASKFSPLEAGGEPLDVLARSWKKVIEDGSLSEDDIPASLTMGIHVYERIFPLL